MHFIRFNSFEFKYNHNQAAPPNRQIFKEKPTEKKTENPSSKIVNSSNESENHFSNQFFTN